MNRCKNILTDHTLRDYDGILIVVTLPRHVSDKEVASKCELTILCSIAFGKDITLLYTLTLITNRTEVDNHILVGAAELRNAVFLCCRLEANELVLLTTVVENTDCRSVNIFNDTIALSGNLRTAILTNLLLKSCTDDRRIVVKQRHSLAHHVTSHQRTVSVIMLEEWD